jgi:hypothetical protein
MQGFGGSSREPEDVSLVTAAGSEEMHCGGFAVRQQGVFLSENPSVAAFVGYARENVALPCNFKAGINIFSSSSSELGTQVARQ